jgi:V/A-type H+-transporting ATPase subunit I
LDPHELEGEWLEIQHYYQAGEVTQIKQNLSVLERILKSTDETGMVANLLDSRVRSSQAELEQVKTKHNYLLGVAKTLDEYRYLTSKKESIQTFIESHSEKQMWFGEGLEKIEEEFKFFVEQVISEFQSQEFSEGVEIAQPEIEVQQVAGWQVILMDPEEKSSFLEFLEKHYTEKPELLDSNQVMEALSKEETRVNKILASEEVDPENLSSELIEELSKLHGALELDWELEKSMSHVFRIEEESPVHFAFLSVSQESLEKFQELLSKYEIPKKEVDWKGEIVDWESPGGLSSFQAVAQSVGTIDPRESDPTKLLAVSFMIFFAFSLSDALYGLLLSGVTGFFYFFKPLKKRFRNIFGLFFYSGLATLLFGILTNSWGGNFFNSNLIKRVTGTPLSESSSTPINDFLSNFQLIDILNADSQAYINQALGESTSPIVVMLLLAIFIGFVNQLMAYYLKIKTSLNKQHYATAISQFAWVFFLFALIVKFTFMDNGLSVLTNGLVGVALLGLLFFNEAKSVGGKLVGFLFGSRGLYGLVQFGADLVSYTRIVAIGLTSGVIATVVNLLVGEIYKAAPGPIGVVLSLVFLLAGHLFNIVLSIFSAYINPLRLTYVEFMPKFFQGEGRQLNQEKIELSRVKVEQ